MQHHNLLSYMYMYSVALPTRAVIIPFFVLGASYAAVALSPGPSSPWGEGPGDEANAAGDSDLIKVTKEKVHFVFLVEQHDMPHPFLGFRVTKSSNEHKCRNDQPLNCLICSSPL